MNARRAIAGWPVGAAATVATLFVIATPVPAAGAAPVSGSSTPAIPAAPMPSQNEASPTIPGPAAAEPTVDIDVTSLDPAAPEPGDVLVIEGKVTNVTDEPLVNVQALLRHNLNPLSSPADLELVESDPRLVWGSRPGHVFAEVADALPAGQSADFRLEAQLETACPAAVPGAPPCVQIQHPGVYVFGVDIREGDPNLPGARVDAGTTLSLVPWLIGTAERSVDVAMLWPVSGLPAIQPDGTLGDVDTDGMMGPTGWLSALLDAPGQAPVTWAVDPEVLDTVAAIADSDDRWAGSAADWLNTLQSSANAAETWLLPFAVPDVAAFDGPERARLAGTAVRLSTIAAQELPTGTRTVAWPVSATDLDGELAAYRTAGVTTAVVPSDVVAADGRPWVELPAGDGHITSLVADATLSSTVALADDEVALRQRWLAVTALAVLGARDEPAPLVVSPPLGWQPSHQAASRLIDVWTATPWVDPVGLDAIDPEPRAGTVLPPGAQSAAQLSPTSDAAADLLSSVVQYETLLVEPAGGEEFAAATVRAASAAWRTDPDAGREYAAAALTEVTGRLSQVSLQVAPTVTLSSNTGAFPVNVVNHLEVPVTVRLELHSANPQRMSVESITAQRIEPGETEILRVTAEAVANGKVRVDLQLATVDGRPIGRTTHTIVNATDYGVIGWFLIVGAGLLFVAGLAVRTVRGKRRNGVSEPPETQLSDHAPLEGASR